MTDSTTDCVAWLYVITNSVRVLFYAPQIRAVLKCEDGAQALSITTWSFWTFAHVTAALYGWFVIHDSAFCAIFTGNLACTAAVTLIATRKRLALRGSAVRAISDQLQPQLGRSVYGLGAAARAEGAQHRG